MTMNNSKRKELTELFDLLSQAFSNVDTLAKSGNTDTVLALLEQCQNSAVAIGSSIEELCGEGTESVKALEGLCEDIYNYSVGLESSSASTASLSSSLQNALTTFESEFPKVKEVVFLPCSSSLWKGFKGLYDKLSSDSSYDVKVIPIPWYEKLEDGSIEGDTMHFDDTSYPEDVSVISFNDYNFKANNPDAIYIQCAFDNSNYGGTVHPFFYTSNLKEFTKELIYVPFFVPEARNVNNKKDLEKLRSYVFIPNLENLDKIIVATEGYKQAFIKLVAGDNKESAKILEDKVTIENNPMVLEIKDATTIPEAWKKHLFRPDGSKKKVILYSNSIQEVLNSNSKIISKIRSSLAIFKENKEDVALIWRPHPLTIEVMTQLRPELVNSYEALLKAYKTDSYGILDESSSPVTAITLADAFYGDNGSVLELFKATGKPIMLENTEIG